jgi:uncharacterized protein (TIGR02118 family)
MIKFTAMLVRNPATTHEQFVTHHKTSHATLFMGLPASQQHVRRYVQSHNLGLDLPGMPASRYDGVTEIWFDDVDGFAAVFGSPEYMATVRPDEESFLDLSAGDVFLTTENVVYGGDAPNQP